MASGQRANGANGSDRSKMLIILHQETSTPGRVGHMLTERGFALDIRRPPLGHPLPPTLADHAGVVMFGGPMSANDTDDYVRIETDWLSVPLTENKPFLGICLGAQILVRHLGGTVEPNKAEFAEVGYYPLRPTEEGSQMMDWPTMVYQWHREGFSLPAGATLLATGDEYPNQAIKVGENAYGIQFHAELTTWMMNRWTVKGAHRMALNGAQDRKQHFDGRMRYDGAVKKWLGEFLDLWIGRAA